MSEENQETSNSGVESTKSKNEKEYIPHFAKVNQAKSEIEQESNRRAFIKRKIPMSDNQVVFAEAFIRLLNDKAQPGDFKIFLELETSLQTKAILSSFQRRSGIQNKDGSFSGYAKTYGEDLSFNEGYQSGSLHFKGERESILKNHLENLKHSQEVTNENEKN